MSSTKRGGQREVSDYYRTPVPVIVQFLKAWAADFGKDGFTGIKTILDPCAGGIFGKVTASYRDAIGCNTKLFPDLKYVETVDIRADSCANIIGDYRMLKMPMVYDLAISNPPFCFAQEFVEKALLDVKPGGYVVMLLRLNFLESLKRLNFWQRHMPERIYVHSERISFTPDGKTDSVAYMHAIFKSDYRPLASLLRVI